ncbi:response regulator [Hymenobacter sp. 15J16-1T3B]|uniref:ATP-binding protein n=1 Tax=Hymenobacter sp. 15J16-1T3B TaxID=2886941 RepID=UPI001D12A1B7|nr:ATP-binding protein [Hymenobacter sp. 15J16-1T3B]MCC3156477.1 response regulator [Hymenobacter sp. 15J16-1T3B]
MLGLSWLVSWALAAPAKAPLEQVLVQLGPEKRKDSLRTAENAALHQHRAAWNQDGAARFFVFRRLALNYQRLANRDSAYHYLHRARGAGQPLRQQYPLEVADVLYELGSFHWAGSALDSVLVYYAGALQLIEHSGYNLHNPQPIKRVDGSEVLLPELLASRSANASLLYRRRGQISEALHLTEQARRCYQLTGNQAGLRWAECLVGEAYEDQGNDAQAWVYYTHALQAARRMRGTDPVRAPIDFADVLGYGHDVLGRLHRPEQLQALAREGLRHAARQQQAAPWHSLLAAVPAALHGYQAQAYLQAHQPDSARRALDDMQLALTRVATLESPAARQQSDYYPLTLQRQLLLAQWARQQHQPAWRQYVQEAQATFASLTVPAQQHRARKLLGRALLQLDEPAAAAAVLEPLATAERQARNLVELRETYHLLRQAYAGSSNYAQAFRFAERFERLDDTLRADQQYSILTAMQTRFRTREQALAIQRLQASAQQQRRQTQLGWLAVGLLGLLLLAVGLALRHTRRLNGRLAALDELKSQFFSNVSHELRTPLTLVVGPVEHLLQQPDALPPAARAQLALSRRNGQRLQYLVDSLLDLAKLEAGRLQLNPGPVRLALFGQQLLASFEALAEYRQLSLTYETDLPADLTLALDVEKLEQIVSNFLSNALKFTPAGGRVTLTVAAGADHTWHLSVRDTGPGIAPEEQQKVFERFYQSPQRQAQGGTGIGLALSRELAALMGGTLTLTSTPGQGCTFTLVLRAEPIPEVLPAAESGELAPDAEAEPDAASAGQPARVLVVEDNVDLRAFLRQILEPHYAVLEAEDGQRALDLLATTPVDLICSDEMMPRLSGTELLQSLKARPRTQRVPFLMVTARSDARHRFEALETGVDDYLQKPFAPRELLARVHNLLGNYHERRRYAAERGSAVAGAGDESTVEALQPMATLASPPAALPDADQLLLRKLETLARTSLADSAFGVEQWLDQLAMSERTLYRKLKELTGLTPATYLRQLRLEHGRQLLERRALPTVAEVAYAVGFEDPAYFAKVFLKHYGKRASDYLRQPAEAK